MKTYEPIKDIRSVIAVLSKISVWGGLTPEQQEKIFKRLEVGTFKKGEYIFRKGEQPTHVYVVKSGRVDLIASHERVSILKESTTTGAAFGIAALMAMQPHMVTAVAVEDTEIMVLSRQALLELSHEDAKLFALLMMNIAREIARRLKATDDMLLRQAQERKDG